MILSHQTNELINNSGNFFEKNKLEKVEEGVPTVLDNKLVYVEDNGIKIGFNLFFMRPWSDYEFEFFDCELGKATKKYEEQLSTSQYSGIIGKLEKEGNSINISMFLSNTKSHQYLIGTMHEYGFDKETLQRLGTQGVFVPSNLFEISDSKEGTNMIMRWSMNPSENYYQYSGWRRQKTNDRIARNVSKETMKLFKIIDKNILPEHESNRYTTEFRVSGPTTELEDLTFRE